MPKIAVGLVNAWMIFELAMRFRSVNDKNLKVASHIVMSTITVAMCASIIIICIVLLKAEDEGTIATDDQDIRNRKNTVQGYIFLALFILMLILHLDLHLQIKKKEKHLVKGSLNSEKCVLLVVLIAFELSYLFRFILDVQVYDYYPNVNEYYDVEFYIWEDLAFTFEALSFLALIVFHFRNLRTSSIQQFKSSHHANRDDEDQDQSSSAKNEVISGLYIEDDSLTIQDLND